MRYYCHHLVDKRIKEQRSSQSLSVCAVLSVTQNHTRVQAVWYLNTIPFKLRCLWRFPSMKTTPNDVEHIHFLFKKDGKTFFSPTWWCISIRWLCWGNILVRDSGGFGGLNITWLPQAHMFGFLTPNWQCCLGRSWQDGALQREGGHQEWAFAFGDWDPLPVCSLIPNCEHTLTNCPPHYSCQTLPAMLNFIPLTCKPPNTAFLP